MALLAVDEALRRLLDGVHAVGGETVGLDEATGRVLAGDLKALRTQPPFPASAMDGYAVRSTEAVAGAVLEVAGESRAGRRFAQALPAGAAVRIFTGAPVPEGADAILIQENADRDGNRVRVLGSVQPRRFVRPAGLDFTAGQMLLGSGRTLDARALSLAASMGHAALPVRKRPRVAILANGDELVPPGAEPGPDQIISSNNIGLAALVRAGGGEAVDLGIAPDDVHEIGRCISASAGADVLVVIGGASVGEHDLIQAALTGQGMTLDFWRIAMRPGKPLIVGRLGRSRVLGLPGNPVSALVCGHVFLKPLIRALLGQSPANTVYNATLGRDMPANDDRQDYVRARLETVAGELVVTPFNVQDSSMLATFAAADALVIRPVHAPAAAAGDRVPVIIL